MVLVKMIDDIVDVHRKFYLKTSEHILGAYGSPFHFIPLFM